MNLDKMFEETVAANVPSEPFKPATKPIKAIKRMHYCSECNGVYMDDNCSCQNQSEPEGENFRKIQKYDGE
jgi:hypothetical protein